VTDRLAVVGLGFIGTRLARLALDRGWQVTALSRCGKAPVDLPGLAVVRGDATDPDALAELVAGASWVAYTAGESKPAESDLDPVGHTARNLEPVVRTLEATASAGARGITFLSSGGTVYGPSAPVPTKEDVPLWPISAYGVAKAAAEQLVAMHAHRAGLAADILRCANVFGPGAPTQGSQGLIGVARAHLQAGEPVVVFGDGSTRRDYLHVDDLADVVLRLAAQPDGVRVLNVGSGTSVSVLEVVRALAAALGVEARVEQRPARASDLAVSELDVTRLRTILDFAPRDTLASLADLAP
jgi:UDP-glucose 4-epimerase